MAILTKVMGVMAIMVTTVRQGDTICLESIKGLSG